MRFIPKDSVLSRKIESLSKNEDDFSEIQWEQEFSARWVEVGAHWGVPKSMLLVHGWLMTQPQPVSTDDAMNALQLSRGNAHTMLQSLVDWKLVHAFKPLGTRQVRYVAETDGFAMLLAVVKKRRERELVPFAQLVDWSPQGGAVDGDANQAEFLERLHAMADQAQRLNNAVERSEREDERWWWRWILGPLRTK